ncbi:nonsense-mediated mRNA decay factor SMG5-like [Saccoglossus kowalevskii]|uniref:Protein SMG5-like n=1 Tax=Saccoglossus kowalevskii TaxID=10224 RepID=A0ABM0MDP0_SACKO|nr:PREDICTED: protein SMG5-like [Saccoglossus kowalevskii]
MFSVNQSKDDDKDTDSVIDRMERKTETLKQLVSVLSEQGLVLSVKVFADWLIANPYIIDTCAQSSQSLWSRLSVFLNHLPEETQINNEDICESCEAISIVNSAIQYNDWHQTVPLTEDYALYKLPSLQQAHQHLEYNHSESAMLSKKDEALVRGTFLRQFGYHLANLTSSVLVYDQEKCLFLVSSQVTLNPDKPPAEDEKASLATWAETQMKMAEEETRRNQLMKDMAQLRLQSEVKQLEGSLEPKNQSNLSPYLVPDTRVLTHHLNIIKQFAACARFIIIIPRVGKLNAEYIIRDE